LRDAAGNLYGTTGIGGIDCDGSGQGCGTVFRLTPKGKETVLYAFKGGKHGANPAAGVIMDEAGTLYGTTNNGGVGCDGNSAACGTVFELTADAKETVLHIFQGGDDGAYPKGALVMDAAGDLYGTTSEGGGASDGGEVFQITPQGKEKLVHSFGTGSDGIAPYDGLVMDAAGNLYGTTFIGGAYGDGTVFKIRQR
jgi:uncharacterized repeat protein (TIGR03803 family)